MNSLLQIEIINSNKKRKEKVWNNNENKRIIHIERIMCSILVVVVLVVVQVDPTFAEKNELIVQLKLTMYVIFELLRADVGYLRSGFEYFLNGFAQRLDQVRPTLHQDRARRALSDALLAFSK
jgi:hypothetical protein